MTLWSDAWVIKNIPYTNKLSFKGTLMSNDMTPCLKVVPSSVEKGLAADMHLHFQTCPLRHLHFRKWRHLQSFLFFILFYLLSIFKLNLSTFYTSIQVVKTRKKKLNYEVTCNCYLHSSLPATSLAIHTNRACCQWRQDAVVVKLLKLI